MVDAGTERGAGDVFSVYLTGSVSIITLLIGDIFVVELGS